ncbi:MAG: tat pathway signal sequence domain protein [Nitrospira sp.]|nr:tat pathway signal sequence domain protein [Nitrospira sp.]
MIGLRMLMVLFVVGCVDSSHAGQFFERNGLAVDGYDPVAYFTEQKPVKGSPEFRTDHQGSTFQFASADHRDRFVADPEQFIPQYGGYCAYGTAKGYKAKTDPEAFTVVHGKLYLNYSDAVQTRWLSDIPGYIKKADANWPEVQKQTRVQE